MKKSVLRRMFRDGRRWLFAMACAAASLLANGDILWCSQLNGDDDYAGDDKGSESHPYATIQAAVNAAAHGDTVKVLPGVYGVGETVDSFGGRNRISIDKQIHLVAVEGASQTTILGRWGSDGEENVRCVFVDSQKGKGWGSVIEGFTLKDGCSYGKVSDHIGGGGVVAAGNPANVYVVDCVFTNCTGGASDGTGTPLSVAGRVNLVRCRFVDCTGLAVVGYGKAFACLFENCSYYRGVFLYSDAVNCTIARCRGGQAANGKSGRLLFNNAIEGCAFHGNISTLTLAGNIYNNADAVTASGNVCPVDGSDGGFYADAGGGDWRLMPTSDALGISRAEMVTNVLDFTTGIVPVERKDLSGMELPLVGAVHAGAFQTVRQPHWYVDADGGNDANDGISPQTAFQTLAAACTNAAVRPGDTIHVAKGVYDRGVCPPPSGSVVAARASVPSGVTLLAEGTQEETIIEGACADGDGIENADYGLGTNAVRCAYLNDNSRIVGFVLKGGRTRPNTETLTADPGITDFVGGGVCGPNFNPLSHQTRVVERCFFTNNVAAYAGAARGVSLRACRFFGNYANRLGQITYGCSHESCFLDNPVGGVHYWTMNSYAFVNTLVTDGNGSSLALYLVNWAPTNCVFLGRVEASAAMSRARNCLFNSAWSGISTSPTEASLEDGHSCRFVRKDEIRLDEGYRPAKGSIVIDQGMDVPIACDRDADGVPRILNGAIDIGPWEYDWRDDFASAIGGRGTVVSSASAHVMLNAQGKVRLTDGETLVCTVTDERKAKILFAVSDGTLMVTVNGVEQAFTADGELSFDISPAMLSFAFEGSGSADLLGLKSGLGFMFIVR